MLVTVNSILVTTKQLLFLKLILEDRIVHLLLLFFEVLNEQAEAEVVPSSSSVPFKLESDLVCLIFVKFNFDKQIISFSLFLLSQEINIHRSGWLGWWLPTKFKVEVEAEFNIFS